MGRTTKTQENNIVVSSMEWETIKVKLVGDSPLITHAWSDYALSTLPGGESLKSPFEGKDYRTSVEEFMDGLYWLSERPVESTEEAWDKAIKEGARFGFPVNAIKKATIASAYRNNWAKDMVSLKGAFFLSASDGDMAEIKSEVPVMRADPVKVGMGKQVRYRPMFRNWSMDITVKFNKNGQYTKEQIFSWLNAAGICNGLGDWRVEKFGTYGMFHIE